MRTISLQARLLVGFSVMAALVVGFAAYTVRQETMIRERVQYLASQQADVQNKLQDLRETLNGMQRNSFHGALNRDWKLLMYATTEAAALFDVFDELRTRDTATLEPVARGRLAAFLDDTEDLYREIMARSFVTLAMLAEGGAPGPERLSRLRLDSLQLNSAFAAYLTQLREDSAERLEELNQSIERLRPIGVGTAVLALVAMVAFLFVMRRYLTQPLRQLDRFVAGIVEPTQVEARAPVKRRDEIGDIAAALNRMLDGLRDTAVSRDYFNRVLASLSNGLIVVRRDMTIATVNEAACALLGRPEEGLLGKPAGDTLVDAVLRLLDGQDSPQSIETEFTGPDGAPTPVIVSVARLPANEGGWTIVATDISERRLAEAALRRSEERYREVVDNISEGILVVQDARIMFANPSILAMTGYEAGELIGHEFLPLIHPDDREKLKEQYVRRVTEEPKGPRYAVQARMKSGEYRSLELSGVRILWEGKPASLSFVSDVTHRIQAERDIRAALEQQKELNYLKSRFVAMTSHEFRTPLATILSSAELVKYYGERLPPSEREELLGNIETAVKRMTQMLEDVLIIGKADAGRLVFAPQPVQLRRLCENLVDEARNAGERNGSVRHVIEFHASGDCDEAVMDEKLLRHILGNLLVNAVKYSPAGGRISFAVRAVGDKAEFAVADEGIGIPAEDLPRLFGTFFRASNVGNIAGTGLGLAIVKRAVDLHGGAIVVESRLGAGTRFVVTLPRAAVAHG